MAAPKLSFFEKVANTAGVIYRYHASHFPRRWDILKKVAERELAPPLPKDLPAIKADLKNVLKAIETKAYKNLTVREFLVYSAVLVEVVCWFFVGEMIGRRNINGYLIPGDYVSKATRTQAKNQVVEDKHNF